MKNYCVYMHINKINDKKYIGLTSQNVSRRWKNGMGYKGSTHFYNAILKYGWDNFDHVIVKTNLTKEEAECLEKELISKYKTQDERYGYNLESGGNAKTHSEETKQLLSLKLKGRKKSPEALEHMHEGYKKRPSRPCTEETKAKISAANKGHNPVSEETKEMYRDLYGKQVLCVELNKVFRSITEAATYVGLKKCAISSVLNGRNKTAAGYHWSYVNNS